MLQETNYCAHAISDLAVLRRAAEFDADRRILDELVSWIRESEKFRVPDFGCILDWDKGFIVSSVIEKYANPFRLPYKRVALEFAHPTCEDRDTWYHEQPTAKFDASIALAQELTVDGEDVVHFVAISRLIAPHGKCWVPSNFGMLFSRDGRKHQVWANSDAARRKLAEVGHDGALSIAMGDLHCELRSVLQLVAALRCRNVSTSTARPPDKINKKRESQGKQPFFSYHVLELAEHDSAPRGALSGTHASPRTHLRRGHIRRLSQDRVVWVNACVVRGELGFVEKDYAIRPGSFSGPKL